MQSDHARGAPRPVAGLSELVADYDLILCDVWGVLHNGLAAYPHAGEALVRARARGLKVVLVSNAPRPNAYIGTMLDQLGVPRAAYDAIVTSGDVTRAELERRPGARMFHIGPPRDLPTFDGLDLTLSGPDQADVVVCTGLFNDDVEGPQDYREVLGALQARGVPLICANPDIVVERGDTLIYCAGALAQLYDQIGGISVYCGKPHRPIYDAALASAAALSGSATADHAPAAPRVLCIGDALNTDILGATQCGFDSLFIAGGIHAADLGMKGDHLPDPAALERLFSGRTPARAVMARLA